MKTGGGGAGNQGGKRRWKLLGVGVLFLVFLSMFVPLLFLLGVHTGFNSTPTTPTAGFLPDESTLSSAAFTNSKPGDEFSIKAESMVPKEIAGTIADEVNHESVLGDALGNSPYRDDTPGTVADVKKQISTTNDTPSAVKIKDSDHVERNTKESHKQCEMRFGSYCLWRKENEEDMRDSTVRKMKDQLFVARAYYPSVAKLPAHDKLSHDLRQSIQDYERVLSECSTDSDLPEVEMRIGKMQAIISEAKTVVLDCSNVDKKLRQILDMTEDEANFHMKQSAFLYQLAVQTKSKSLHCLFMKLTVEYFKSNLSSSNVDLPSTDKYMDSSAFHYVIFSNNVLASSVVINSTVVHSKDSRNLVFHVITDKQNYFALRFWFAGQKYMDATVDVLNVEDLSVEFHDMKDLISIFMPVEFRMSLQSVDNMSLNNIRIEYLSVFSPAYFLLPYIFPTLKRVILLDDDVVVQRDLSDLWTLNMEGKVNGALQLCSVQFKHLSNYLVGEHFDANSCVSMSGLNVIDLARWRELNLTQNFSKLTQEVNKGGTDAQTTALVASILAFQDQIYPLRDSWTLPGLGHNYELDVLDIRNAAVLHYNGNMKPWLEIGIPEYKQYWKKFLDLDNRFLGECNVHT